MPQYFDNEEPAKNIRYPYVATIHGKAYALLGLNGTFSKSSLDRGTQLMLETLIQAPLGSEILDLGCGTGPLGLILAASDSSRHLTLSDVNLRALDLARENAESLGVASRVTVVTSDVYTNIFSIYDTIVANPPIRAGKKVTYAMYDGAPAHLKEGGRLIIVIRKKQGADSVFTHLQTLFKKVEILEGHKGYRIIAATK
jgi:16S rRNA (guanine1207-N2)-methyltransferase